MESVTVMDERTDFVRLLVQNQHRIYGYILALLPDFAAADDVYQETCTVLWQKFAQFEPGTDFFRWASTVARFKVLKHRQRRGREALLVGDSFLSVVEAEVQRQAPHWDLRRQALAQCLQQLPDADRRLLQARYEANVDVQTLAAQRQRTVFAIYKALTRIRQSLLTCIERRVAVETAP
ncbi:MAG: sigma-70 family RNA polymerase sigma factor [Pirellulales bacterium]|nr:sigma-70 family RNA polymerase sigma factor [Pirellulales bacterium]